MHTMEHKAVVSKRHPTDGLYENGGRHIQATHSTVNKFKKFMVGPSTTNLIIGSQSN
jgi:hypothetical protein